MTHFFWEGLSIELERNKNCFEILMAKEMGLDRATIEIQFFLFFPCIGRQHCRLTICIELVELTNSATTPQEGVQDL